MRTVRFQVARILRKTGLADRLPLKIDHPDGYRLRFHAALMSRNLWVDPTVYGNVTSLVRSTLQPGDTFVDAGANIGLLTLAAASVVGVQGRVIAIEPHPRVHQYLRENVELNGFSQVDCFQCAVGETNGDAYLSDRQEDDENTIGDSGAIQVPVRTLDSIVPSDVEVRLLKLDVEGYELFALRGATATLGRTQSVMFEGLPELTARYGHEIGDVIRLLGEHGFRVRAIREDGTLEPVGGSAMNYLATR